jgi:hypothetical protein
VDARLEGYVLNLILLIFDVSGDAHFKLLVGGALALRSKGPLHLRGASLEEHFV